MTGWYYHFRLKLGLRLLNCALDLLPETRDRIELEGAVLKFMCRFKAKYESIREAAR